MLNTNFVNINLDHYNDTNDLLCNYVADGITKNVNISDIHQNISPVIILNHYLRIVEKI